uniref:Uncharacterized protein n=1 Tax=Callorhinchus milii TaxID=7868 RepID=A0A4W3IAH7_CALMI
ICSPTRKPICTHHCSTNSHEVNGRTPGAPPIAEPGAPRIAEPGAPPIAEPGAPRIAEPGAPRIAEPSEPGRRKLNDSCSTKLCNPAPTSERTKHGKQNGNF